MSDLLQNYRKTVISAMQKKFGIENIMAVPRIEKAVVNVGIGKIIKDDKLIEKIEELDQFN